MGAEGNISPLTVTTTDGLLYLNDQGQEGNIYQTNIIFGYDDLQLRSDPGDNAGIFLEDDSGINPYIGFYTKGTLKMTINNAGNVSIPTGGSLTVTDLANCGAVETTGGLLGCGTDADTWVANSQATAGYVAAGGTNNNKVWKTDGSGIPSWRDDATAGTISGTAGEVAFFNSGTSVASDSNLLWNDTNNKLSMSTGTLSVLGPNSQGVLLEPGTNDTNFSDIAFYNVAFKVGRIDAATLALQSRTGGNVGIGTSNPNAKLTVAEGNWEDVQSSFNGVGSLTIVGLSSASQADSAPVEVLTLHRPIDGTANPKGTTFGIALSYWQNPSNNYPRTRVDFKTTGRTNDDSDTYTTVMSLRDDGRVGIGDPTPDYNLDVSGTGRFTSALTLTGQTDNADGYDRSTYWNYDANVGMVMKTAADNGATAILFPSTGNFPSDFAYIVYDEDYGEAGVTSGENAVLILGSENDGTGSSDHVRVKSRLVVEADMSSSDPTAAFQVKSGNVTSDLFTVLRAGNVGIGTDSPNEKLTFPWGTYIAWEYSDTDSGVYHRIGKPNNGAGPLQFKVGYTSGTTYKDFVFTDNTFGDLMTILSGGNVGIGMTSPPYKLSINPGASQYALGIAYNSATAVQWIIGSNSSGNLIFHEEGVGNKVTFEAGGDVGIGTTPSYKLDVNGTIRARDFTGAGGQNIIVGDDTYLTDIDDGNMLGIYGMQNSDRAGIRLGSDGSYIFGDNGRVGIGTKNPRTALDVGSGDIITDGAYYGPHRSGITPGLMLSMKEKILNCVWVVYRCDPPGTSYPSCPSGQVSGDTYGPLYTGRSCSSQGSGTCSGTTYKKTFRACLRIYAGP